MLFIGALSDHSFMFIWWYCLFIMNVYEIDRMNKQEKESNEKEY